MSNLKIFVRELLYYISFILIWGVMYFPAIFHLNQGYLGGIRGDVSIYIYLLRQNMDKFFSWPLDIYEGNFFYPYTNVLTFSDNFILPAIIAKPIFFLTGNIELTWNIIMILGSTSGGYLTFVLARHIFKQIIASYFCGIAFMCLPFIYSHLGHPQLQFTFGIPAIILSCICYLERRSMLAAFMIGFVVVLQFLTTVYYAIFIYLLAILIMISYAIMKYRTISYKDFIILIVSNLPNLILLYYLVTPYTATKKAFFAWSPDLIERLSASFYSYFSFSGKYLLWGKYTQHLTRNGSTLGLGIVVLLLFITSLIYFFKSKNKTLEHLKTKRLFLISVIIFLLAALYLVGIHLFLYDHLSLAERSRLIPIGFWLLLISTFSLLFTFKSNSKERVLSNQEMQILLLFVTVFFIFASIGIIDYGRGLELYTLLYKYLPGFDSIRAVYRLGVVASLLVILIATFSITRLSRLYALLAVFLILIEYKIPYYKPSLDSPKPKIFSRLNNINNSNPVIILPLHSPLKDGLQFIRSNSSYMMWMSDNHRPMLNGWSGKVPKYHQTMGIDLDTFPSQKSLNFMGQIVGLKYVVSYRKFKSKKQKKDFIVRLKELKEQIRIISLHKKGNAIFEINPIIRLHELRYPDLYIKSDSSNNRVISFKLKTNKKIKINLKFDSNHASFIELLPKHTWQEFQFELPKSTNLIRPERITFENIHDAEVLIKSINITIKDSAVEHNTINRDFW